MKILVIGSGGREHALVWKLAQSPHVTQIYASPGNPGIAQHAQCLILDNHDAIIHFCKAETIALVVVGPEQPLVNALEDHLFAAQIPCVGPSQAGAQLEGSKAYTKSLCREYHIPTAHYATFHDATEAKNYIRAEGTPIVIKADALAAGKGVIVAQNLNQALDAVDQLLQISESIVVEECLMGEEASFFCLTDGDEVVPLASAQDHKRAYDGDQGPNTGGMGAYSPAPIMKQAWIDATMERIIRPTLKALGDRGIRYRGVLYAGLMMTEEGPKLIEYNCRFGDPECQVLMMRLESDLLPLLLAVAEGRLAQAPVIQWKNAPALTVVMAAQGYPGKPRVDTLIQGVDVASQLKDCMVFHAATKVQDNHLIAAGGRVLNVTALGADMTEVHQRAYQAVEQIDWPEGFYRKDIGWRAL